MKRRKSKSLLLLFLLVVFLGALVMLIYSISSLESNQDLKRDNITKPDVYDNLLKQTLLVQRKPANKEKEKTVNKVSSKLKKDGFSGAYLGIKNDEIIFSDKIGNANNKTNSSFKLTSSFFVGKYQDFLKDALIINFIDNGQINLNESIGDYIPGLQVHNKIQIKDFLTDDYDFFIDKNKINMVGSLNSKRFQYKYIDDKKSKNKSIDAHSLMKTAIIAKAGNGTYSQVLKKHLIDQLDLSDTRLYSPEFRQANDVKGYKTVNNRESEINFVPSFSLNELRMSVFDVLRSTQQIFNNKLFSDKYNDIFYDLIDSEDDDMVIDKNQFQIYTNSFGQYISLTTNLSGNGIVIIVGNNIKSKNSMDKINEKLFSLIE